MQHHLLNFGFLFDAEDEFFELFTWNKISSTRKILSRPDKSLSRYFENRLEAPFVLVVLHTVIVRLFLRCRVVGGHLHFVRHYGQRSSVRR